VVSLFKPRATLGQRQFLIKPRTQINIQQFSGKITPPQYKKNKTRRNTPRRQPYTPTGLGGGSLSGLLPDVDYGSHGRGCRSDGRFRRPGTAKRPNAARTFLSATATSLTHAPTGSPATPRRQRRHDSTAGRRSRFRFVPRTDRHSLLLLPTTATSLSADVPWLPVSSGEPTQHPAFLRQQRTGTAVPHSQRRQHSRCEAPLRLTQSIRLGAISLSAHCRALTQLNFTPLDFSTPLPHTAKYACVL